MPDAAPSEISTQPVVAGGAKATGGAVMGTRIGSANALGTALGT
jgi:hypothetical protein